MERGSEEHMHTCAVKWVIVFVGIGMIGALAGGIAGIFMKSMANEHSKDMITGSFSFAQMALTGLLGLLAKTGLETATASTQTGDINQANTTEVPPTEPKPEE